MSIHAIKKRLSLYTNLLRTQMVLFTKYLFVVTTAATFIVGLPLY